MTTKSRSIIAVSALFAVVTIPAAHAQILFSDKFNSAPSSDINSGIGAPRQTGSLVGSGGVSYSEGGPDDGFRAQVSNNNNPGLLLASRKNDFLSASPNLDFQSNNYSISFGLTLANVDADFS